jgi:hypothetical protein
MDEYLSFLTARVEELRNCSTSVET